MNTPALERFLARIYVDHDARMRFLANPRGEAERAGLNEHECQSLEKTDRTGLALASRSFAKKRNARKR
jgi:hypothetical protein